MILEVEGLTKRFGGLTAVDRVSFSVGEGGIQAVIGPNGAGKTTLFNLISGFLPPTSGRVRFEGADITAAPPHRRAAAGLVRTFQLVRLFGDMSVEENVRVGAHVRTTGGILSAIAGLPGFRRQEAETKRAALRLLDLVGLGLHAGRPAASLTYGHQRLLELARALAAKPRLLLLDEPAAGLNAEETDGLSRVIRDIAGTGVTVLLIEHDVQLVMDLARRVTVLDFGRTIADGTPAEVQENPAVIEAYLGGEMADA